METFCGPNPLLYTILSRNHRYFSQDKKSLSVVWKAWIRMEEQVRVPFYVPVNMVVAVEIVQTSGAPLGYGAPLLPRQRSTSLIVMIARDTHTHAHRLSRVNWWEQRVLMQQPPPLTKQASRSSKEPLVIRAYTRHGCCPSQENPTMSTKFWCFNLRTWTHSSKSHLFSENACSKPLGNVL